MARPIISRKETSATKRRRSRPALAMLALAGALSLTACESDTPLPFMSKPIVLQCPDYAILEEASLITKFKDGPGRDIIDVEYRAEMANVRLECLSDIDNDTNSGRMEIDVSPIIGAELGAAASNLETTIPYFVVVTDPENNVLYREELGLNVSFKGNRTRLVAVAPATTIEIPITPTIRNKYYRVICGFALTHDQVDYNRALIKDRLN